MLVFDFLSWWYSRGWASAARNGQQHLQHIFELFSVELLLRTLVAPWRRIITYPGASLDAKLRAWSDNSFSRIVGFVVRLVVLITAGVAALVIGVYELGLLIIWPFLPLVVPASLIAGLLA